MARLDSGHDTGPAGTAAAIRWWGVQKASVDPTELPRRRETGPVEVAVV